MCMESVTLTRQFDASPAVLEGAITDVEPFMRAAGFDEVVVAAGSVTLRQSLGLANLELVLVERDDAEGTLAYEQESGIFETMETSYVVDETPDGATVTATTQFSLGGVAGTVLDSTLVKRQRTREFEKQLDYLETVVSESATVTE